MRIYLVKKFFLPQISQIHGNAKKIFYSLKMHEIFRFTGHSVFQYLLREKSWLAVLFGLPTQYSFEPLESTKEPSMCFFCPNQAPERLWICKMWRNLAYLALSLRKYGLHFMTSWKSGNRDHLVDVSHLPDKNTITDPESGKKNHNLVQRFGLPLYYQLWQGVWSVALKLREINTAM